MRFFKVSIFFHSLLVSLICAGQGFQKKSIEVGGGLQITNGKYPNGIAYVTSIGVTERQKSGSGWFVYGSIPILKRKILRIDPRISLAKFSHSTSYNYPDTYTDPRLINEYFEYQFLSVDILFLFKILEKKDLEVFPYAGVGLNFIRQSSIRTRFDMSGQLVTSQLSVKNEEDPVNYSYETGFKLVRHFKKHSITSLVSYNHFFNEQYNIGRGKLLYSFRFGLGYTF